MNIRSDVKLGKALDMMLQEIEGKEDVEECPLYQWMNDLRLEVAEENTAGFKNLDKSL